MTPEDAIAQGRAAFDRHAWTEAYQVLRAADEEAPLVVEDLERIGIAAHLTGQDDEAVTLWGRAHHEAMRTDDVLGAARMAFRVGMALAGRGDMAVGGGWLARAARLVEESGLDCVERGWVLVPQALRLLEGGDAAAGLEVFDRIAVIAERFADPDLDALGRLGRGRALIALSEVPRGVALLDEAMVAVTAGEVSPIIVGTVYCASIEGYQAIFDLRRAQEWTEALAAWCDSQPDLVPFRGRCLVYRAELLQLHGAWPEAIEEARRAQEVLSKPPPEPAVGEAYYQQAEVLRLRGNFADADVAYREASLWGRRPDPGLAILRLAQGQPRAAFAAIRRAVDEAPDDITRARLLGPQVDIALATGELGVARKAADALAGVAGVAAAPLLTATAQRADGVVLLAEGDARGALSALRSAAAIWYELDAPYESALIRVSIGLALRQLGDSDSADLEFDAARRAFVELGAAPDLARLVGLVAGRVGRPDGLSTREVEVLRLLAAGRTNRSIAGALGISERTVDRHVSNIFTKIDVSSRSAATAYAYEHDLR
ncbi:MAG: LuxR C-terminal-related transcriptional regulator [Candidatus Limnocylindrales bacterium]